MHIPIRSPPYFEGVTPMPPRVSRAPSEPRATRPVILGVRAVAARGLNRTENVRAIPPGDPDFYRLYARRNDSESLNRLMEDSLFIGRAHSLGRSRQLVDLLGWALLVFPHARTLQASVPMTS